MNDMLIINIIYAAKGEAAKRREKLRFLTRESLQMRNLLSKYAGPPLAAVEVATQPAFEKACQPACLLTLVKGSESDEVLKPLAKKSAGELLKVVQIDTAKQQPALEFDAAEKGSLEKAKTKIHIM